MLLLESILYFTVICNFTNYFGMQGLKHIGIIVLDKIYYEKASPFATCFVGFPNERVDLFNRMVRDIEFIIGSEIQVLTIINRENVLQVDTEEYNTSQYKSFANRVISENISEILETKVSLINQQDTKGISMEKKIITARFKSSEGYMGIVFIEGIFKEAKHHLLKMYIQYLLLHLENLNVNALSDQKEELYFELLENIIRKSDPLIYNHVKRVCQGTEVLANALGYDCMHFDQLLLASSIHDIGKVFVPDAILNKPGALTSDEYEIVKGHTVCGLKRLKPTTTGLSECVHNVVSYHHENWDGSGYPEGLERNEIPLEARIVSVIDVFEALTNQRPYKDPWPYEKAKNYIISQKSLKFDPAIIETFSRVSETIYDLFCGFDN